MLKVRFFHADPTGSREEHVYPAVKVEDVPSQIGTPTSPRRRELWITHTRGRELAAFRPQRGTAAGWSIVFSDIGGSWDLEVTEFPVPEDGAE